MTSPWPGAPTRIEGPWWRQEGDLPQTPLERAALRKESAKAWLFAALAAFAILLDIAAALLIVLTAHLLRSG